MTDSVVEVDASGDAKKRKHAAGNIHDPSVAWGLIWPKQGRTWVPFIITGSAYRQWEKLRCSPHFCVGELQLLDFLSQWCKQHIFAVCDTWPLTPDPEIGWQTSWDLRIPLAAPGESLWTSATTGANGSRHLANARDSVTGTGTGGVKYAAVHIIIRILWWLFIFIYLSLSISIHQSASLFILYLSLYISIYIYIYIYICVCVCDG